MMTDEEQVQGQQAIVVKWMERQLARLGWSADRWAREANLAPTTVTRAMKPPFRSVSSVPTLESLARAARVASPLDFLDDHSRVMPNRKVIEATLQELLPAAGFAHQPAQLEKLTDGLAFVCHGLAEGPAEAMRDPAFAIALAHSVRDSMSPH